jgi:hypothetical protein
VLAYDIDPSADSGKIEDGTSVEVSVYDPSTPSPPSLGQFMIFSETPIVRLNWTLLMDTILRG